MANRLDIPVAAQTVAIVPAGPARPTFVYVDQKRTEEPKRNAKGQPLHAFDALVQWNGVPLGTVRISSPVETLPELEFGGVLTGTGNGVLSVSNDRQGFDLRIGIELDGLTGSTRKGE